MAEIEIQTANVKVPNENLEIDAYLAMPTGKSQFPGVIVIQEIFGVNAHIREVTERIAKQGIGTFERYSGNDSLPQKLTPSEKGWLWLHWFLFWRSCRLPRRHLT